VPNFLILHYPSPVAEAVLAGALEAAAAVAGVQAALALAPAAAAKWGGTLARVVEALRGAPRALAAQRSAAGHVPHGDGKVANRDILGFGTARETGP
jgi:hypothetical protein